MLFLGGMKMTEQSSGSIKFASPLDDELLEKSKRKWNAPQLEEIACSETSSGDLPPTEDGGAWSS